jgi:hypothetical protein
VNKNGKVEKRIGKGSKNCRRNIKKCKKLEI